MATTWNPSDKGSAVTLSGGNLTASISTGANAVRGTASTSAGPAKWYWEVVVAGAIIGVEVGVANATFAVSGATDLGGSTNAVAMAFNAGSPNARVVRNSAALSSTFAVVAGDVIGFALDTSANTLAFYVNNVLKYTVLTANMPTGPLFPAFGGNGGSSAGTGAANFGATTTTYTPPTGFSTIDTALLNFSMTTSGGVLVGGEATFFPPGTITTNGGVLVGGTADMTFKSAFVLTSSGGVLLGGGATFEFPTTTLSASLPPYQATGVVINGTLITLDEALPGHTADGTSFNGSVITLDETLPAFTMVGDFGWFAANTMPAHVLEGTMLVGTVSSADLTLPVYALDAALISTNLVAGDNALPAYVLDASAVAGSTGTAALLLPVHQLVAAGFAGAVLTGDNTLPLYVLVAQGFTTYTLTGANTLPAYRLDAAMSQAVAAAFRAWVLNVRKRPLTEYTNFPFNSFAVCEGRTFAAGPNGIFELTTATDDAGTDIAAVARTGKHDFGVSYAKRVPRIYAGVATEGDLEFRTITGADGRRGYLLPWNNTTELQQRRVPIGRGPKSTYWQFEVLNRSGADFTLDSLIVRPDITARRVSPG